MSLSVARWSVLRLSVQVVMGSILKELTLPERNFDTTNLTRSTANILNIPKLTPLKAYIYKRKKQFLVSSPAQ